MKTYFILGASVAILTAFPLLAQETKAPQEPGEIVAAATTDEWVAISPTDLLVMDLAPGVDGKARRAIIQLMPAPFSRGWVGNIRKLATAHWWDGTAIVRVQDNYVTQWGDPDGEDAAKAKKLPDGLVKVPESEYVTEVQHIMLAIPKADLVPEPIVNYISWPDPYAKKAGFSMGWPVAMEKVPGIDPRTGRANKKFHPRELIWPLHCYAAVGVGRNLSPDTGTGAELYTVIGHAPRQLDRNIAVVGRVIEGMENLSSLPRGTGQLGFYETPAERVPIVSVRLASELPKADQPKFEYLSTESRSFAAYADKRANRKDDFYNIPAGGVDICNISVPIRRNPK